MDERLSFHSAISHAFFPFLSLVFYLMDAVLDVWAVKCLYKGEKYFSMGLLIFLLLGSSVLRQIFSWLWYSGSSQTSPETKVERFIRRRGLLGPVHLCQLGVFLRCVLSFPYTKLS